jgi:predicted CoA-substrate-specific enzyme activase
MNNHKQNNSHFLGIDLGSSYTKFIVVDNNCKIYYNEVIPTLSRRRESFKENLEHITRQYNIHSTCATGYGRNSFASDIKKTELICASAGVSFLYPQEKCVIDIGGEDIKIIESGPDGEVTNFYMNDKCSAGTGAFITEIAEKAELEIGEMNELARKSSTNRVINSFCTVFAKTEILGWKFDGVPIEDIARGIYLSIVTRINKLPVRHDLPLYLCGGVIAYHPFIKDLLSKELNAEVQITTDPQYMIALGAAILARKHSRNEV